MESSVDLIPHNAPHVFNNLWHVLIADAIYARPQAFVVIRQGRKSDIARGQNELGVDDGIWGDRGPYWAGHEHYLGRNSLSMSI